MKRECDGFWCLIGDTTPPPLSVDRPISVVLFVLGTPAFIRTISSGGTLTSLTISFLQIIGQIVAYGLLLTPSAREWLNEGC